MESALDLLKSKICTLVQPSTEEWNEFSKTWKPFSFPRNYTITDFGMVEPYFYFIAEGVVRGYFIRNGEEYSIGFSYKGEFSGAYDSFVTRKPAQYGMETLSETTGLKISHNDLMSLFDRFKIFERWGRLFNQHIMVGFGVFLQSILADSAEERFNRLVQQSPHIFQLVPQKHLASYLGMTPETFSRMRKKTMG